MDSGGEGFGMKILILVLISSSALAQSLTIYTKDGKTTNTIIGAFSKVTLFTRHGNFLTSTVDSVAFQARQEKDNNLYKVIGSAGIKIVFNGKQVVVDPMPTNTAAEVLTPKEMEVKDLETRIELFRKDYETGVGLELLGIGLSVAGVVLAADPQTKDVGLGLAAAGGVSSVAGLVVQLGAGKKLKAPKKP